MQKLKLFIGLCLFTVSTVFANPKYFNQIKKAAKAYRVDASLDKMKIIPDSDGKESFHLTLSSNRNNFEMVMLVGYIAAGQAMKSGFEPAAFFVTVDVPLGEGFRLVTTASKDDLKKLLKGEINTAQFVRKLKYI